MIFLQLFYTFFKIGLFGFGGGYAMLSMIQGEVVTRHGWITAQEFTDIVAISQMTPGPIGINSATFVGYSTLIDAGYTPAMAVLGSATATFAVILPSFILMLIISRYFLKFQKHPAVIAVFSGLRPAVVGLLAAAALLLMNSENFGSPTDDMRSFIISCLIFIVVFIATRRFKISPILMIVLSGIAGLLLYQPV
ncbi:MAG: chromate transporter [Bacteroides sp.]|nr:chromate transporter [Bacteroides sp.]